MPETERRHDDGPPGDSGPGTSFSRWLRHRAGPAWSAMVDHRLTQDMAQDNVPPQVLRRYLAYERAFVETAVAVVGYALVKAPTLNVQARYVESLNGLVGSQLDFFARADARLDFAAAAGPVEQWPIGATALRDGMLALAAHGTYEEIVAGMAAAEWMYHTWCRNAARSGPKDETCAEWIDLHVQAEFAGHVDWLRQDLDARGPDLPADVQERLAGAFRRILDLEISFHDAPYLPDEQVSRRRESRP